MNIIFAFSLYHTLLAAWLIYFAAHDIKTMQIEKTDRYKFLPFAVLSLIPNTMVSQNMKQTLISSILGAAMPFVILLGINVLLSVLHTSDKGIGGGDIKFFPYLGFIYGITDTFLILFLMGVLMIIYQLIFRKKKGKKPLAPIIAISCILISIIKTVMILK